MIDLGSGTVHLVSWDGVEHVTPTETGDFSIRLARVGGITVPRSLGRAIWDRIREKSGVGRRQGQGNLTERARPARV